MPYRERTSQTEALPSVDFVDLQTALHEIELHLEGGAPPTGFGHPASVLTSSFAGYLPKLLRLLCATDDRHRALKFADGLRRVRDQLLTRRCTYSLAVLYVKLLRQVAHYIYESDAEFSKAVADQSADTLGTLLPAYVPAVRQLCAQLRHTDAAKDAFKTLHLGALILQELDYPVSIMSPREQQTVAKLRADTEKILTPCLLECERQAGKAVVKFYIATEKGRHEDLTNLRDEIESLEHMLSQYGFLFHSKHVQVHTSRLRCARLAIQMTYGLWPSKWLLSNDRADDGIITRRNLDRLDGRMGAEHLQKIAESVNQLLALHEKELGDFYHAKEICLLRSFFNSLAPFRNVIQLKFVADFTLAAHLNYLVRRSKGTLEEFLSAYSGDIRAVSEMLASIRDEDITDFALYVANNKESVGTMQFGTLVAVLLRPRIDEELPSAVKSAINHLAQGLSQTATAMPKVDLLDNLRRALCSYVQSHLANRGYWAKTNAPIRQDKQDLDSYPAEARFNSKDKERDFFKAVARLREQSSQKWIETIEDVVRKAEKLAQQLLDLHRGAEEKGWDTKKVVITMRKSVLNGHKTVRDYIDKELTESSPHEKKGFSYLVGRYAVLKLATVINNDSSLAVYFGLVDEFCEPEGLFKYLNLLGLLRDDIFGDHRFQRLSQREKKFLGLEV
ncbi:MAG TPA: hypothetical protein VGL38_09565 [bacterium]|jgi:uncharacterized protein (UPF0335 family)